MSAIESLRYGLQQVASVGANPMIAAAIAEYDALATLLRAARQDLVVWEAAHGMKGETTTPALIASIDAAIGTASQPTAREDADHG